MVLPTPPEMPPIGWPGKFGSSVKVSFVISTSLTVKLALTSHGKSFVFIGVALIPISIPLLTVSPTFWSKKFSRLLPPGTWEYCNKSLFFL